MTLDIDDDGLPWQTVVKRGIELYLAQMVTGPGLIDASHLRDKGKTGLATASTSNMAQQLVKELVHWSIQIKAGYGEHHNSR